MRKEAAIALLALLVTSRSLSAQTSPDAGTALVLLLFGPSGQGVANDNVVQAFVDTLANGVTSFPLAASSGGFTYRFDPALPVPTPRSDSFGPIFAERPLTNGRRVLNVGFAFQRTTFDSLAGQPLDSLKSTVLPPRNVNFAGVLTYESDLEIVAEREILTATYGLTDSVDIGVTVPFGRTAVSGSSVLQGRGTDGRIQTVVPRETVEGSSAGVADIAVKAKIAAPIQGPLGLAASVELRLPTGDPVKLLGVGVTQAKAMLISAGNIGRASPHINVGYVWSGSDASPRVFDLPIHVFNEFDYTIGVDINATSAITIAADAIGRTLKNAGTIQFVNSSNETFFDIQKTASLNILLGTVGAKMQVGRNSLLVVSAAFPLNNAGVVPRWTPVVGFEHTF